MPHEMLNLRRAAEHVHLEMNVLKHCAQRGELAATERGGDWWFDHQALDEWAQRALLSARDKDLREQHRLMTEEHRRGAEVDWGISELFSVSTINLAVPAKAKAGILRDLTDLADAGGKVYDPEGLFKELVAREETASTAIGEGVALPHPRFHDPYMFERSFVAYGRSERPIFFGASNGEGTRHFFLICSTDHALHLHILARLAMLAHGTDMVERLETVATREEVIATIRECEAAYRT